MVGAAVGADAALQADEDVAPAALNFPPGHSSQSEVALSAPLILLDGHCSQCVPPPARDAELLLKALYRPFAHGTQRVAAAATKLKPSSAVWLPAVQAVQAEASPLMHGPEPYRLRAAYALAARCTSGGGARGGEGGLRPGVRLVEPGGHHVRVPRGLHRRPLRARARVPARLLQPGRVRRAQHVQLRARLLGRRLLPRELQRHPPKAHQMEMRIHTNVEEGVFLTSTFSKTNYAIIHTHRHVTKNT